MERTERLGSFRYVQGSFPLGRETLLLGGFPAVSPGCGCAIWGAGPVRCLCCC